MKSLRKELWFNAQTRVAFINITKDVSKAVKESGVKEGLCLVNAMHITASVFINDDESGLHQDYQDWLEKLAPHDPVSHYRHNRTVGNIDNVALTGYMIGSSCITRPDKTSHHCSLPHTDARFHHNHQHINDAGNTHSRNGGCPQLPYPYHFKD